MDIGALWREWGNMAKIGHNGGRLGQCCGSGLLMINEEERDCSWRQLRHHCLHTFSHAMPERHKPVAEPPQPIYPPPPPT